MTEPSRRDPTIGCATDEAQLAARRAFVVQLRAGSEPAQRRLLGRVEHVSSGQATTFESLDELLAFIGRVLTQVDERRQDRPGTSAAC